MEETRKKPPVIYDETLWKRGIFSISTGGFLPSTVWSLKITRLKSKIIFQTSIFGFHVNFPGCRISEGASRPGGHFPNKGSPLKTQPKAKKQMVRLVLQRYNHCCLPQTCQALCLSKKSWWVSGCHSQFEDVIKDTYNQGIMCPPSGCFIWSKTWIGSNSMAGSRCHSATLSGFVPLCSCIFWCLRSLLNDWCFSWSPRLRVYYYATAPINNWMI